MFRSRIRGRTRACLFVCRQRGVDADACLLLFGGERGVVASIDGLRRFHDTLRLCHRTLVCRPRVCACPATTRQLCAPSTSWSRRATTSTLHRSGLLSHKNTVYRCFGFYVPQRFFSSGCNYIDVRDPIPSHANIVATRPPPEAVVYTTASGATAARRWGVCPARGCTDPVERDA